MERKKSYFRLALLIVILLLVLVFIYSGLRFMESTVFPSGDEQLTESKTIVRDGVAYFPKQDMTVILLSGIDEFGPVKDSGSYNNSGEADMVSLLIFDHSAEKLDIISLNRDIMLEVPVLGIGGKEAGSIYGQLALAHTYGSGLEDSSINLRNAVSEFLYGLEIDYYVTMNMDAIGILNDAVGGVTVNVSDDFSEIDATITKGELTLTGDQAITFVRTRQGVGNQMNLGRMERQKEYMRGFMDALRAQMDASGNSVISTYEEVSPYVVTDCSATTMSTLMDRYGDYELGQVLTLEGENVAGEKFMEYYVDEDALDKLILEYLYVEKNN